MWHRWNPNTPEARPGAGIPDVGDIIVGRRNRWRVLEVRPVDSPKHENAWRGRLEPLGPHGLDGEQLAALIREARWYYAAETMPEGFRPTDPRPVRF